MLDPLDRLREALLDRYRLGPELGRGGMATVYLADDLRHGRKVAIKVLRPELGRALGGERFLREIRTTAALDHPNILTLIDSGEAGDSLFYVMPYVSGESLRSKLRREGALPLADAVTVIQGVGAALEFAHQRGVIHRDVKPENILLYQGTPVVTDFGIALAIGQAGSDRLTETGYSLGTPAYMSPEQITGTRELDGRGDQYSLACVLYEMLAGTPPFTAPKAQGVFVKQVTEAVPPLRGARGDVPAECVKAIERALAKDPADRFASIAEFRLALSRPSAAVTPPAEKSIVVLPFVNLSPDPANEYFGDGLTEELIADLSKVRELRVIARNSAMRLKGTTMDAPTLGRELRVRYVLGGSVRRAGNDLRITAQLSDAESDRQIWAEKYTGTFDNVFDLQETLSRRIVEALQITLTTGEHRALADRPIKNPAAYEYYARARHEVNRMTKAAYDRAVEFLREAERLEGPNVLLSATLGLVYCSYQTNGMDISFNALAAARECLQDAIRLDPDSPYVGLLTAVLEMQESRLRPAIRRLRQVLERIPTQPDALLWSIFPLVLVGATEAAKRVADRLRELDPLYSMAHQGAGMAEFFAGRYSESLPHFDRAIEVEPENWDVRIWRGWAQVQTGDRAAARDIFTLGASKAHWSVAIAECCQLFLLGLDGDIAGVEAMDTPERVDRIAKGTPLFMFNWAEGNAMTGRLDAAVDALQRAMNLGLTCYPLYATDVCLTNLRGFPRFEDLLIEVKTRWEAARREFELQPQ